MARERCWLGFILMFVLVPQLSDKGVSPSCIDDCGTKIESSSEMSSGQKTVEFLFQLGAEYLAR